MNDVTNTTANINSILMLNVSNFKSWKKNGRSNCMSLMIMKKVILEAFRNRISENMVIVKEFLVRATLGVHHGDVSYCFKFGQLKVSYNFQKETWSFNESISLCVQEEEILNIRARGKKKKNNEEVVDTIPQKKQ
ncbi:hypothetical protein CR513_56520, partial [Mucuna pruriens]